MISDLGFHAGIDSATLDGLVGADEVGCNSRWEHLTGPIPSAAEAVDPYQGELPELGRRVAI